MICIFYPCSYIGCYYRQHILKLFCTYIKTHYYLTFSQISQVHITTFLSYFVAFVEEYSDLPISYETASVLLPWLLDKYHAQKDPSMRIKIEIDSFTGKVFHIKRK